MEVPYPMVCTCLLYTFDASDAPIRWGCGVRRRVCGVGLTGVAALWVGPGALGAAPSSSALRRARGGVPGPAPGGGCGGRGGGASAMPGCGPCWGGGGVGGVWGGGRGERRRGVYFGPFWKGGPQVVRWMAGARPGIRNNFRKTWKDWGPK